MNAPLMVSAPMIEGVKTGAATTAPTEFIDIYPSLCDLVGLPKPGHLDGTSFVPLLKDPAKAWKPAAIGRYRAGDTIRQVDWKATSRMEVYSGISWRAVAFPSAINHPALLKA